MSDQRDSGSVRRAAAAGDDADVRRVPAGELEGSEPAEDEIRIPIVEEELVIQRRPVVREVLVIKKRVVTETQEVEADLRKERVQVEGDVARPEDRE